MDTIKFGGSITVKKIITIKFEYDDGTVESIVDPRACALFQSRCNSNGILVGIEDYIAQEEQVVVTETV